MYKTKDFRVTIGEQAPNVILHAHKKKVPIIAPSQTTSTTTTTPIPSTTSEEATKEEGIEKEKGENATEETTNRPPTPKEKEGEPTTGVQLFELNEVVKGRDMQHYIFMFFYRESKDFEDR